jgi:glyceraldehyde-3-phosphate dehydrogenase/erythrose-4-phosphate dehydrogenase
VLADFAKNDKNEDMRIAAVKKLTDQSVLADFAKNDKAYNVRIAVVSKLTDQSLLADIAKNDENYNVRIAVVSKLTDQSLLADIAKNDKNSNVCEAAVNKLTDQSLLADFAKNGNYYFRTVAINKITSQQELTLIANNIWEKCTTISNFYEKMNYAKTLCLIVKKSPISLKHNWKKIEGWLKTMHNDSPHSDNGEPYSSSDCNHHEDCRHNDDTAKSKGITFPPYPFKD